MNFLNDDNTDIFFGKLEKKYKELDYFGLFAYNQNSRNMIFFLEDPTNKTGYSLHSYASLTLIKENHLENELILY